MDSNYSKHYRGYLAAKEKLDQCKEERFKKAVKNYYKNPNKCLHCGNVIKLKKGKKLQSVQRKKFCSHKCAGDFHGALKGHSKNKLINCLNCGGRLGRHKYKYCSLDCQKEHLYNTYITKWKNKEVSGGMETGLLSRHIRTYLFRKYSYKCCKCSWGEKNIYSNKIPLEVNHINGDNNDHIEKNLELLCPNCHSLTPTYKGLNMGKGRKDRALQYHINKYKKLLNNKNVPT